MRRAWTPIAAALSVLALSSAAGAQGLFDERSPLSEPAVASAVVPVTPGLEPLPAVPGNAPLPGSAQGRWDNGRWVEPGQQQAALPETAAGGAWTSGPPVPDVSELNGDRRLSTLLDQPFHAIDGTVLGHVRDVLLYPDGAVASLLIGQTTLAGESYAYVVPVAEVMLTPGTNQLDSTLTPTDMAALRRDDGASIQAEGLIGASTFLGNTVNASDAQGFGTVRDILLDAARLDMEGYVVETASGGNYTLPFAGSQANSLAGLVTMSYDANQIAAMEAMPAGDYD